MKYLLKGGRHMRYAAFILLVGMFVIAGCTATQKGATVGAAAGAGLGAIIGHQSGHGGQGALIGAGAGALGGALIADAVDKKNESVTKFCPQCGRRFDDPKMTYCPYDGGELKPVEDKASSVPSQQTTK
jgi:hypothetical protein